MLFPTAGKPSPWEGWRHFCAKQSLSSLLAGPGHRDTLTQLCRKRGKFQPQFVGQAGSLAEALDLVTEHRAVLLMPELVRPLTTPFVQMIPIIEPEAATAMVLA